MNDQEACRVPRENRNGVRSRAEAKRLAEESKHAPKHRDGEQKTKLN